MQRLVSSRTLVVNRMSDEFLARPGFSKDQDRGIGRGDLRDRPADRVERGARANQCPRVAVHFRSTKPRSKWCSRSANLAVVVDTGPMSCRTRQTTRIARTESSD